jgi:uncharacterized repeat protein (TIGR02543 family)
MKKGILFRGLGLALAVSIAATQGSFVSMAAEESAPAQVILEDELLEELTETPESPAEGDDSASSASSDAEELLEDVSEDDSEDISENSSVEFPENNLESTPDGEEVETDATVLGGEVANGIKWDLTNGVLTISGNGSMPDYDFSEQPWRASRDSIKKVVIKGQITSIGKSTFYYYRNLKEVVLDSNITAIGDSAFLQSGLESITFPSSLKSIGSQSFKLTKLKKVVIPEKVTAIGYEAFNGCSAVTEVEIKSKSISAANSSIFDGCSISKLTLPKGITEIPRSLFSGADFNNCTITIPATVKKLGISSFASAKDANGSLKIVFEKGSVLTTVSDFAFDRSNLENIDLPDSVREIGLQAFSNANLKQITLPSGLMTIDREAFQANKNLKTVNIKSKQISSVGDSVFAGCSISSVIFPDGIREIPARLFHYGKFDNCKLTIPRTVTKIGDCAFYNPFSNGEIIELNFQEGSALTSIGASAFEGADIRSLKLPESLVSIGSGAFEGCAISEIVIPSKVTTIGKFAFCNCKYLEKVDIRSTVLKNTENSIFEGCNISEVKLAKGMTLIPGCLFQCATFNGCEIEIPNTVTTIGYNAFESIGTSHSITAIRFEAGSKLTKIEKEAFFRNEIDEVILPGSLKEIGYQAFGSTNLTEIVIPSGVTTIGAFAFGNCKYLTKVTIPSSVKKIDTGAFSTTNGKKIKCFVKSGSYAYKWVKENASRYNYVIATVSDISYVLNGGTNDPANPTVYESGDTIYLNDASRIGYTFDGWYLDAKFKKNYAAFDSSKGGKLTVYAKWTANTYTVRYDLNAKDAALTGDASFELKYSAKYPKKLSSATRTGYKFAGWYTLPVGGTKVVGGKTLFKSKTPESARLYAHWTPVKYKITYKLAGGKLKKKGPATYTTNKDLVLPVPTKTGYTFTGWEVVTSAGKAVLSSDKRTFAANKGYYGNVTVKATWKVNVYKLVVHVNNSKYGEVTYAPTTLYTYDQVVKMSDLAEGLKNAGVDKTSKITGFNTKANGKGKNFAISKKFSKLCKGSDPSSAEVTTLHLYARWKK